MRILTGTIVSLAVAALIVAPLDARAQEVALSTAMDIRLVVVSSKTSLDTHARSAVQRQLERRLASEVTLVPNAEYTRQAKAMGYNSKNLATRRAASKVGAAVDVTYVLLLTGKSMKRRSRRQRASKVEAALVSIDTGEVISLGQFKLKRGALDRRASASLLERVRDHIESAAASVAEVGSADELFEPSESDESWASDESAETELAGIHGDGGDDGDDPFSTLPTSSLRDPWAADHKTAMSGEDASVSRKVSLADRRRRRQGSGLRLAIGPMVFNRAGGVTGKGIDESQYRINGYVPGLAASLEIFPMALLGSNGALAGFGLQASAYAVRVASAPPSSDTKPVISTVMSFEGGATYRWRLFRSGWAPHLALRVGYSRFAFPLDSPIFPGVTYQGPQGGLEVIMPLGSYLSAQVGGTYIWPVSLDGQVTQLGSLRGSSTRAYSAQGGLTFRVGLFELTAIGRLQQFNLVFSGSPSFAAFAGATDAGISDRVMSGQVLVGLVL
ncbi:MAG: hypothetical protein V3T05_05255 [Myxococcota bacterium]